ncbi:MAG: amidohydrolase family protein [Bryobacteraceae bacterium]|nr:amidohydrolase family protein [Bryobacteraceae bacterium]MDW8380309.1 M15 family metallopeptidase [Bryobacterales bacterium]
MRLGWLCLLVRLAWAEPPFDVVISGGRIVDGTGNPWFAGDVAIRGDRITRITPAGVLRQAPAKLRIDATGLVVAPGFIDILSHPRHPSFLSDGRLVSKVTQGITTEIFGAGFTDALMTDESRAASPHLALVSLSGKRGFERWLRAMHPRGVAINFGSFLAAEALRSDATGTDVRGLTAEQLETLRRAVRSAMEDGALGIAFSSPAPLANQWSLHERIELAQAMAPYGGIYATPLRSEGERLLEAVDEAIEIGRRARVAVEIQRFKAAGQRNWSKLPQALEKIQAARGQGLDLGANTHAYTATEASLTACLPPGAQAGSVMENLSRPEVRRRLRAELTQDDPTWDNLCTLASPENVLLLSLQKAENRAWSGRRLSEIAAARKSDWVETVFDLLASEAGSVPALFFLMSEEHLALLMRQPWMKFGVDAPGLTPGAVAGLRHPQAYGNHPRLLGKYVREEQVISLEEAVRKMSSAVARRLSIPDRGELREGAYADVVIFDPRAVVDRANFEQPQRLSAGVRDVFVNGVAVLRDGVPTEALPGRIIRGPGYLPRPPEEEGDFLANDWVELSQLDPTIQLDVRYATANNFAGRVFYTQPRVFLQRPAAEALVRAHRKLRRQGFGLKVFDGYRPWQVTRMFWELTPADKRAFVADPSQGSRHNRGCAVDVTLYDRKSGLEVEMPSGYDEMSERAHPNYSGGTARQRSNRDRLRRAMEEEGFTVFENEWWHFDYKDWRRYRINDIPFEQLGK